MHRTKATKSNDFLQIQPIPVLQALVSSALMEPSRTTFQPAGAGALLAAVTGLGLALGALLGWLAGSWGIGALVGAVLGIPAGVFAVYRRYRGFFT